jgi:hypothetical protein
LQDVGAAFFARRSLVLLQPELAFWVGQIASGAASLIHTLLLLVLAQVFFVLIE